MGSPEQSGSNPEIDESELPLEVISSVARPVGSSKALPTEKVTRKIPRAFLLLFIPLLLFTGAVIGIYVQPPALRAFLRLTGLRPGGGTSSPIAVPVEDVISKDSKESMMRSVVALGRLAPEGKVISISPPFGSGDSRIEEIKVEIGSRVQRGEVLVLLDNRSSLESALASAEANVALQRTTLEQTRSTIGASLEEAKATLERAKASESLAQQELQRMQTLRRKQAVAQADLEQAVTAYSKAQNDVEIAEATVSRFDSQEIENQPDVAVAARRLDAAIAEMNSARLNLARGTVTAPVSGTILDIHARPGEKPGAKGILDIGNIERMTAELEVYQSEIGLIAVGQRVELTADALSTSLLGIVSEIGFSVEPQTTIDDNPAANTDARIVKVTIILDDEGSKRAARLTNLEVTGRINVEDSP